MDETEKAELDRRLAFLASKLDEQPEITIEYFIPDDLKSGISEIASLCGWADPFFFSRLFKQKEGMTPRIFRIRQREKMLLPQSSRQVK